ncbi:MAG TPA: hypothetical protein VMV10_11815 [Pirellulales bacterium]|nr:hypothetical protein [Pirellulales bacterium]
MAIGRRAPQTVLQTAERQVKVIASGFPPIDGNQAQVIAALIGQLQAQTEALVRVQARMNAMFQSAIEEGNRLISQYSEQANDSDLAFRLSEAWSDVTE